MAKRDRQRGGRTTPKGTRSGSARPARDDHRDPPLVNDAGRRLREPSPFGLLAMASGLIEVTTPRPTDVWERKNDRPDGPSTFLSFVESGVPGMVALARAIATMHPDELLARRLRTAADKVGVAGAPKWLATMGTIEPTEAFVMDEPLGDGDNIAVGWRWPDGAQATMLVYVDHNMGTIVKDAFVVPESAAALNDTYRVHADPSMSIRRISLADAAARITDGIDNGSHVVPPIVNDTWPTCRPMVEWALRHLPAGGTGYVRPVWSEADRERLLDEFIASPFAQVNGLSAKQLRDLVDPLLWFACDYGPGDPLRWSPVSVEIVLADWYPRKVLAFGQTLMRKLPDALAAFVRFAHHRKQLAPELTADTLRALDDWRRDYLAAINAPRSAQANATRLARAAMGPGAFVGDGFEFEDDLEDDDDFIADDSLDGDEEYLDALVADLEHVLIALMGGEQAYRNVHDKPLGDVPFDWSRVPAAMHEPTKATLDLLDEWTLDLCDAEVRTIARVVLAAVVANDQAVFKRSSRPDALAAGLLGYLLRRLTGRFSAGERASLGWTATQQKDIAGRTGVAAATVSSRSRTVANVVDRADIDWPSILHSSQRREVMQTKRKIQEWRASQSD